MYAWLVYTQNSVCIWMCIALYTREKNRAWSAVRCSWGAKWSWLERAKYWILWPRGTLCAARVKLKILKISIFTKNSCIFLFSSPWPKAKVRPRTHRPHVRAAPAWTENSPAAAFNPSTPMEQRLPTIYFEKCCLKVGFLKLSPPNDRACEICQSWRTHRIK